MSSATVEITKENFRLMPLMMSRAQFLEVTGLGEEDLAALVKSKAVEPWYPPGREPKLCKGRRKKGQKVGGYAKYKKIDAAKIAGVEEWLK